MREAVARYKGCEFIPLRVQDAFDRSWWERVSGDAASTVAEIPVGLSDEGSSHWFFEGAVQIDDASNRFRANRCFEGPSSCSAHAYSYSIYSIHLDEIAIVIHSLFYRCFTSSPGHVSYFFVDIPYLLDISRGRLCRATGNTGRMGPTFCQTHSRNHVVEWRGPFNTAAKRRQHEGVHRVGLVASSVNRWEAEGSNLRADHW